MSTSSIKGGLRFEHRLEKLRDGKTKLTIIAASGTGIAQDEVFIDREAQNHAESYANRTCPTGYDFYADTPLKGRQSQRTYVFQCK